MRTNGSKAGIGAFTIIELLCVIAIIAILAALLFPAVRNARIKSRQIGCVNNLHEAGIAFQSFAHDHNGQFPMAVAIGSGGSLEFVRGAQHLQGDFYFSFRHFQTLSNELATPKVLVCPADLRLPAASFAALSNLNISYFIGVTAEPSQPDSILAGDRNVTNDFVRSGTVQRLNQNASLRWTAELHGFKGNLLFSDGRVESKSGVLLISSNNRGPSPPSEFHLPSVPPPPGSPGNPETSGTPGPTPPVEGSPSTLSPRERDNDSVVGTQPGAIDHRQAGEPAWMPYRKDSYATQPRPSTEPPVARPFGPPDAVPPPYVPVAEVTPLAARQPTNVSAEAPPPAQSENGKVVATAAPPAKTSPWVYLLILLLIALLVVLAVRIRSAGENGPRE